MKKNKALRIAAALLVVAMLTTCGMTGALAKYVDTFEIPSSTVRAGLFKVTGPGTGYKTFDTKIYEGNLGDEHHAQAYGGLEANDNIIVPGSVIKVNGFKIVNLSEVDVTVGLDATTPLTVTKAGMANVTLYYKVDPSDAWSTTLPTAAQLLGATTKDLKNYPAAAGGDNEVTLKDFYILWPFTQSASGGPGIDGIGTGTSTDAQDTTIGKAQAAQLLTVGGSAAVYVHDGDCTETDTSVAVGDGDCDGLAGCQLVTPAVEPTGYADAKTTNYITVTAKVNAVQID